MKNNRKNRRLDYIRRKNAFRQNGFILSMKLNSKFFVHEFMHELLKSGRPEYRNYKSVIDPKSIEFGWVNDDFAKDRVTATIRGKLIKA